MSERDTRPVDDDADERFDSELDIGVIVKSALALGAIAVVSVIAMWFLMVAQSKKLERRPQATTPMVAEGLRLPPPEPRLEPNPSLTLETVRSADLASLNAYGWIDAGTGVAHIPIDEAIDLVVAGGGALPRAARPLPGAPPALPQSPDDASGN